MNGFSTRIVGVIGILCLQAISLDRAVAEQPERSPIAEFRDGFPLDLSKQAQSARDLSIWLSGGDVSVWINANMSQAMPTAVIPNRQPAGDLPRAIIPAIGKIEAETKILGSLSLDEFMVHPQSYAQAFMVVHQGRVVYENHPALRPTDSHLWMSNSKTIVGLVIELLIDDGLIDDTKTLAAYIPEFAGTAWENVRIVDVLDMTPGLSSEENDETRADPDSIATRTFLAEFGMPYNGTQEVLIDVLLDAETVREPGTQFEYGSPTTQTLVYLAEAVTGKRWARIVDERIWSKLKAEAPLQVHTTPDGIAAAHGLISSRLSDMARFGMLFTPSWHKVASEQVVTPAILDRIRSGVRTHAFYMAGFDGKTFTSRLNDTSMISNSRQWDAVWPDGDIWKSGLQSQGLYVSPNRDLVIVFFSVNVPDDSIHRFLRPIATSGYFDD